MSVNGSGETSSASGRGRADGGLAGLLRGVALVAVVAGAVGSVGLTLRAGHRNDSRLLVVLFAVWVLSPFVGLVLAMMVSKRWSVLTRATLHSVMVMVTAGSLAIYGNVISMPPGPRPAFRFLVVPLGSWLLMAIIVPIAWFISGRRSRRDAGA